MRRCLPILRSWLWLSIALHGGLLRPRLQRPRGPTTPKGTHDEDFASRCGTLDLAGLVHCV
eukprot:6463363-Amphidinium_carterae.2